MSEFIKKHYENLHSNNSKDIINNGHKLILTYQLRKKLIQYMIGYMERQNDLRILDAGCGNGFIYEDVIKPKIKSVKRCVGVDFVEDAIKVSKNIFDKTQVGNVLELSTLINEKFDLVNSMEVFLYIAPENRENFFMEHISRVDKNGYFLLTIPNLESIYRKIFKPEKELFPYNFNINTILKLYQDNKNIKLVKSCGIDIFKNIYNLDNSFKTFISFELSFLFQKNV